MSAEPDSLYALLPAIYRIRDEEQGGPLRALMRVIGEQAHVLEADIETLYDNWFVETAQDWVVPYIGDLLGYRAVSDAGDPANAELARRLVPRRDVAGTIRSQRRKGTLALLEELARDVADWPARAVELYRLLAVFQNVNHLWLDRGRTLDVRSPEALDRLDGPFDELAHTVDVRRIQSSRGPGRHNIPSVGLFVWRLQAYPVTSAPAACLEEVSPTAFTFSVLGNDAPLYVRPRSEVDPTSIATELNLPVPIRREALASRLGDYYGRHGSFRIWVGAKRGRSVVRRPVPPEQLVVADLGDWEYRPRRGTVLVDPERGRLAFPPGQAPSGVWVSYAYGFSADIGGGEYGRPLVVPGPDAFHQRVGKTGEQVTTIEEALRRWQDVRDDHPVAVIELVDSEVYSEQLAITLRRGESLEIRAADRTRPVVYLTDRQRNLPDSLTVTTEGPAPDDAGGDEEDGDEGGYGYRAPSPYPPPAPPDDEPEKPGPQPGGCFRLDGLLVTGRAVHVEGALQRVEIRHCTLVPGWGLRPDCHPLRPAEPSLELYSTNATVSIERSIVGSIVVYQDEVAADPVEITVTDSIVDATGPQREAVGAPNWPLAHAALTFRDTTVFGRVLTHAILLGENTIFSGEVRVARRQLGCLRYCYVPPGSRTPMRHRCQPDLVEAPIRSAPGFATASPAEQAARLAPERLRVAPAFTSVRYGTPGYAQLAQACPEEIVAGADDESEMGAFHDLYQPQRLAGLRSRLEQYTPARTDVAVITAS